MHANGYTYDFDVYTGWRSGEECSENGLGYDVVRKRSHPLENQGYHLYLDNFYTSPTLVKDLYSVQIPASCGTAAENRRGFPETFEERQRMGKKKRKRYYAMGQGWKNVGNMVTGLLLTVLRNGKLANRWRKIDVLQPKAIQDYNMYMNGVDRSDQILGKSSATALRNCMRW